jgi:hypothetical protein
MLHFNDHGALDTFDGGPVSAALEALGTLWESQGDSGAASGARLLARGVVAPLPRCDWTIGRCVLLNRSFESLRECCRYIGEQDNDG